MNSSLIGKVEKARRYAQEKERVSFNTFEVKFHGENDDQEGRCEGLRRDPRSRGGEEDEGQE